jgi:replicative DNA helicase
VLNDSPEPAFNCGWWNIKEAASHLRIFVRQHQCRLIVVNYIRLIKAPGKELREQVGNATDGLRPLAKTEGVAVIALSQLARPTGKNMNARPTSFVSKNRETSRHMPT